MKLNLNEQVKVKLTDLGLKILEDDYNRLKMSIPHLEDYMPLKIDAQGYSKMQLHELMSKFGKYMCMDISDLPIEMNIFTLKG